MIYPSPRICQEFDQKRTYTLYLKPMSSDAGNALRLDALAARIVDLCEQCDIAYTKNDTELVATITWGLMDRYFQTEFKNQVYICDKCEYVLAMETFCEDPTRTKTGHRRF